MLNKCCLCHFHYFVQSIKVTVSFESLFFVRPVFCVFVFVFSPVSLNFIFSCLGLLKSLLLGHFLFSSSRFLVFHTLCAFSSLGFTFLFLPLFFFFSSLLSSVSNSPTLSRHGSLPVRSARSLSNEIVFRGCVKMGSPCSPGFSPLSLVILTWLRTGLKAFLVVTFQPSADLCMLAFPDPAAFVAGQLHCHLQEWKSIAASSSSPLFRDVLDWLENKVQVQPFSDILKAILRANILTQPPHPSGSFTITSLVLLLRSLFLTRFCNAFPPVLFRFGVRWAR